MLERASARARREGERVVVRTTALPHINRTDVKRAVALTLQRMMVQRRAITDGHFCDRVGEVLRTGRPDVLFQHRCNRVRLEHDERARVSYSTGARGVGYMQHVDGHGRVCPG